MLRYVRYTVIALSVVFLLATSVSAALESSRHTFEVTSMLPEEPEIDDPEGVPETRAQAPETEGPIVSGPVAPSVSAPVITLPVAEPPDPALPPREINPRQKPIR